MPGPLHGYYHDCDDDYRGGCDLWRVFHKAHEIGWRRRERRLYDQ